ncbi:hypothetical protein A3I99_02165 [Candidatus Kaiserbacteria bacterium RIFCSPLOWO2_02_FULL_45_11b]|uniref:Uncharacterized protein n=1 Tax=Candidatus Kaiserbacteria bacterium RIFCSPLOWO2_12_FULL_45_26 TaxID=1798525 RepID=A0A1F6FHM7_9BACT|nr:MAG: hypothetical protein A2Z56_04695 [Candidatus Kaiserbacteria bacterium RIFCSPHIGHO2_12_45_16]OGG70201.1 MAG: hypothetical protein A2929_03910 [Candidatus Kaiserbacteria bacterium RIFCSPLOWO2_01_FULL_45_25]OGG81868.1 MAG: hypothetical protein A3I99_02165 [Candidatus Kaiserbacteria bacterium RIFCSPLOWO2_02_FULL_45_11b]OGG85372.1 MAG: hypothetical protein A3G90_04970 [Candidatus Kaiserbacteria bacterium RIFCSPLOWO2_12_FULL_45_26]
MNVHFCKTIRLVLVLATIILLMICLWQLITTYAFLSVTGQGWGSLIFWAIATFLVAKALPNDSGPRRIFRGLWGKC